MSITDTNFKYFYAIHELIAKVKINLNLQSRVPEAQG